MVVSRARRPIATGGGRGVADALGAEPVAARRREPDGEAPRVIGDRAGDARTGAVIDHDERAEHRRVRRGVGDVAADDLGTRDAGSRRRARRGRGWR